MVNSFLFIQPPVKDAQPPPRRSVRAGNLSSTPILASTEVPSAQPSSSERFSNAVAGRLNGMRRASVSTASGGHRPSDSALDISCPAYSPSTADTANGDSATGGGRLLPRTGLLPNFMKKVRSQSHSAGSPSPFESSTDSRGSSLSRLAGWASRSSVLLRSDLSNSTTDLPLSSSPLNTRRQSATSQSDARTPSRRASESSPASEISSEGGRRVSGYGFFRRGSATSSGIASHEDIAESPVDVLNGLSLLLLDSERFLTDLAGSTPTKPVGISKVSTNLTASPACAYTPVTLKAIADCPSPDDTIPDTIDSQLAPLNSPPFIPLASASPTSTSTFPLIPQIRNFEGLSLASPHTITPLIPFSPDSSVESPIPAASLLEPAPSATTQRMRTLPRLLSSDAYTLSRSSSTGPPDIVADCSDGESETDSDESSNEEDESPPAEDCASTSQRPSLALLTSPPLRSSTSPIRPSPFGRQPSFPEAPPRASGSRERPQTARTPSSSSLHPYSIPVQRLHSPLAIANRTDVTSYFDRPIANPTRTPPRSPGGTVVMSPLAPMSAVEVARGKRPTRQDESTAFPFPLGDRSEIGGITDRLASGEVRKAHRRRHSATALGEEGATDVGASLHEIWKVVGGPTTPGPAFLSRPSTPAVETDSVYITTPTQTRSTATKRLSRPRSMYELHIAPPAYFQEYARPGLIQPVYPRDEEGSENLPRYNCAVHFEGWIPRKAEFTAPTVQARDRAWKRNYIVLHGTSIKIFKHDLKTHPLRGEEDWSMCDAETEVEGPPALHVHVGEYGASTANGGTDAAANFINEAKAKMSNSGNQLLRHYSLQNAESGLAADYLKRQHVVRVRAEGEQVSLTFSMVNSCR